MRPLRALAPFFAASALAACALETDIGEDVDSQPSAANAKLRVAFDEVQIKGVNGGDAAWFDAARGGVLAIRRTGTGNAARWVELRWEPKSSSWLESASAPVGPNDPQGVPGTDHAFVAGPSGSLFCVDLNGNVWSWNGGAWTSKPAANGPTNRKRFVLAYDGARSRIVLFGGTAADTREWDGASWSTVATTGPAAADAVAGAMVFDPVRKKTVLAGGGRDTWLWDGSSWTSAGVQTPANPGFARLIWNPDRKKVTFVSGNALWEWNGKAWSSLPVRDNSGYRRFNYYPQLGVYDGARRRIVESGYAQGVSVTEDYVITSAANLAPELTVMPAYTAYAGDTFVLIPAGRDADGDRLTYTISPIPSGARTAADGALVWTPPFDALGDHDFQIQASDGKAVASGNARVTVLEPVFAPLFPRGPVSKLGASVTLTGSVSTEWTNGSAGGAAGSTTVSVSCAIAGLNPTGLDVTCDVSGRITAGNSPGPFSFEAKGRLNGKGAAYLSYSQPGRNGSLDLSVRANAAGEPELAIRDFRYSHGARFGMTGWPGYVKIDQRGYAEASAPIDVVP
jgi:hypothetical protein